MRSGVLRTFALIGRREVETFLEIWQEILECVALVSDLIGPLFVCADRSGVVDHVVAGGAAAETFPASDVH